MSKLNYTNDDLLHSIKLGCMVPISQIALTDEDILFLASEELTSGVLATILKAREDYNVYVEEQAVNNDATYPIPTRASGSRFRVVFLKDSNNNLYRCSEIAVSQVPLYDNYYESGVWDPLFYVQNDKIIFLNHTAASISASYVVFHYYMDPSQLVETDECLTIQSINTDTGLIEVDERQIPATFEVGSQIDFIQHKPQNVIKKINATVVSVSSNSPVGSTKFITVDTSDIPSDLEVGDYIALAGETPVPQLVANLRPLLSQATICRILESQGDNDNKVIADRRLKDLIKNASAFIQDRTEGNAKKIVNRNGILRNSFIGRNSRSGRGN